MGWSLEIKTPGFRGFFKRKIINKIKASLTWVSFEKSNSGMKNNPDLLEVTKVVNSDADLATYER